MSQFFQDLWESIFTPGPTRSLLIATNATFAVLQVVLFALLLATYSAHFLALSLLSGGLWWAINWFARELQAVQAAQDGKDEEQRRMQRRRAAVAAAVASAASADSETEVEGGGGSGGGTADDPPAQPVAAARSGDVEAVDQRVGEVRQRGAAAAAAAASASATGKTTPPTRAAGTEQPARPDDAGAAPSPSLAVAPAAAAGHAKGKGAGGLGSQDSSAGSSSSQRLLGSRSGVSTEDEWEKVSENENDK